MRWWSRLAVLTLGVSAALTVAAPSSADTLQHDQAQATVSRLADAQAALSAVPADFEQIMGYEPTTALLSDGTARVINPEGSCSVPGEGRPYDFTVACQAHDFGYDLLRYAQRQGQPLAGSARLQIDDRLYDDLWSQCSAQGNQAPCEATVGVFAAGVAFNSWRQVSGPPIDESGLPRTAGLILLAGLGLSRGWFTLWRRLRRRALSGASTG